MDYFNTVIRKDNKVLVKMQALESFQSIQLSQLSLSIYKHSLYVLLLFVFNMNDVLWQYF